MAIDGKIPKKEKTSKKKDTQPETIDFTSSVDQSKCSRQLSTIFNILDHQKSAKREELEIPCLDEKDEPMESEPLEPNYESEIHDRT
jgi:hypothetical protein